MSKINKKSILRIIMIFIFILFFVVLPYEFFIGSTTIRFREKDYCNFEGFRGYSNLEIFPENPEEISDVTEYFYLSMDTFMAPTCKVFMECVFDDKEMFEQECNRLSQITVESDDEINEIKYKEDLFRYPAYVAIYDLSSCYEYALILEEEQKIIYVFCQSTKVDKEYMPINKKEENDGFSIYKFGQYIDLKYR